MRQRVWQILLVALLTLLSFGVAVVVAGEPGPQHALGRQTGDTASGISEDAYNTVITVTSGTDPSTSKSETCYTGTGSDASPCTLRRAIVESRGVDASARPVLIKFDIPEDAAEGYDSSLGVWEIVLSGTTAHDLRELYGDTTIDGSTQPGGRDDGPKIIVDGDDSKNYGFILRNDGNTIRGLAMQHFKTAHISVSSSDNVVEENWFGLSSDGSTLSSGDDTVPEYSSAVALADGADGNVVRNNLFAGFYGAAVAIRGNGNVFTGNAVGMRADGTVPIPRQFDKHPCTGRTWAGGSGITVSGSNHEIGGPNQDDGNRFAGLYLDISELSEPPFAIELSGTDDDNLIQNNVIGLDAEGDTIGICGRGIKLSGGPLNTQVISNTIVEPGLSAILMNDSIIIDRLNGNTLRGNVIKRDTGWPEEQGDNTFPEAAIAYGSGVPDALRNFAPAQITQVDSTAVSGTSGSGSPCEYCTVEVFLEDQDNVVEALQSLAVVEADENGNWSATLPAALGQNQALRTMSTVPDDWTITDLYAGTTSNLSELYVGGYEIFLPVVVRGS